MMDYQHVESRLGEVVGSIANILNIPEEKCDKTQLQHKIKLAMMKIFQEYWDSLVPNETFSEV